MSGVLWRIIAACGIAASLVATVACQSFSAPSQPTQNPFLVSGSPTAIAVAPTATVSARPSPTPPPPTSTAAAPTPTLTVPPQTTPSPAATGGNPTDVPTPAPSAIVPNVSATETPPPGTSIGGTPAYVDDRTDGAAVIRSYYNAINRKEFDRAYSYWEPGAAARQLPSYPQFKAGFANTTSVQVTIGPVGTGVGAGQMYNSVPVALITTETNDTSAAFVGCYTLHLGNPAIQDLPPFQPWAIQSARITQLAAGANPIESLPTACSGTSSSPGMPTPAPTTYAPTDISKSRYLDDRSTPEELIRSLFNAVNRQEYDRAYSYWESGAPQLPTYAQFKQGYQSTESVQLTIGQTKAGVGAGQLYFDVPTTLIARTTSGQTQTFVGCYTVHLAQPLIQDQPPYQPMQIQSASVKQVANGTDPTTLMAQACPAR